MNGSIGTGHLVEAIQLTASAAAAGLWPVLVVPPDAPAGLVAQACCPVESIVSLSRDDLERRGRRLARAGIRVAVTDFALVQEAQLVALWNAGLTPYCIDEAGGRALGRSAAVFNPMLVESRHRYPGDGRHPPVYAGPAYCPLASAYQRQHACVRQFSSRIRSVVVSMGGLDRTGATLRIVEALEAWRSEAECHVVVGAACVHREALAQRLRATRRRWHWHEGVTCLADRLAGADVAITAGGDTLRELACVGTPAIVLHEDPHEAEQGQAFEAHGFGTWLGRGTDVEPDALVSTLARLEAPERRRAQSAAGRALVDGRGAERITRIIQRELRA